MLHLRTTLSISSNAGAVRYGWSCAAGEGASGGSGGRQSVEEKREGATGGTGASGGTIGCVDRAPDHENDQEDIVDSQVAANRPRRFGVAERLLQQLAQPPPPQLERRPHARILPRQFAEGVETRDRLNDVPKQNEECVGIAGVVSRQSLGVLHLLEKERGGQISTVREVPIQRRLSDPGAPRDLVHRDIGAVGEQVPRCVQDGLPVAPSVLALPCLSRNRHTEQCSAEDSVRKGEIAIAETLQRGENWTRLSDYDIS
jgi:hypothetical protein